MSLLWMVLRLLVPRRKIKTCRWADDLDYCDERMTIFGPLYRTSSRDEVLRLLAGEGRPGTR